MSLELALQENTAAIRELAALIAGAKIAVPAAPEPKAEVEAPAPKAKPSAKKETPAPAPAPEPKAEEPASAPAAKEPEIAYQQVADAIIKLASTKGRTAAVELLGSFGVNKGTELKPEQYGQVLAAASVALGA